MMMSPGVQVNEIDLSIVVPQLGNSTAAFAGVFTKGPSDKYVLITNVGELISNFGKPTNDNYSDWFQAYSFLQYSDKLLVSRAVDANGTFTDSTNTIADNTVAGKLTVSQTPDAIKIGSIVKFDQNMEDEFKVLDIVSDAVRQEDSITVNSATDNQDYIVTVNGSEVTFNSGTSSTVSSIASGLAGLIEGVDTSHTNIVSVSDGVINVESSIAGVAQTLVATQGDMTVASVTLNVEATTYDLVFEQVAGADVDFTAVPEAVNGASIFIKDAAYNAIAEIPRTGMPLKTASELHASRIHVPNSSSYEVQELSIPVDATDKLKFIAKSSGAEMNATEIAIANESDFVSGTQTVFSGILLNDLFENAPLAAAKEIAVIIRKDGKIEESYIVSLVPGSKDYRNKSNYIEDIINKYSNLVYVKDNTATSDFPDSRLYTDATYDANGNVVTDAVNKIVYLSNGSDGSVNAGDIALAYGSVSENTIFGNKEEIAIDIVIANEQARIAAGTLASERADCIGFIGAKFEDVVGLASSKIVENLIKDVLTGELNNGGVANSYNAFFGNYGYVYDQYNDKFRWIGLQGHAAGLRAQTNSDQNSWWASAGIERGQMKGIQKLFFNPSQGQRDFLYKNKINPVVSFPGLGNAIIWGQKTLQSKDSAFSRINVRGLFNTLERSIARMAKFYLFEFNDEYSRNRFIGSIKPFLDGVKAGRGVYDFYVRCDETNNTPAVVDANQFVADIAVKPTRVAEFITLNFVAVATGVEFTEIFA